MIVDLPAVRFTDDEWKYILNTVLRGWTEIPLRTHGGYSKDLLKFYDGIIGYVIKDVERMYRDFPKYVNMVFLDSWKYQGKLYRVIHKSVFLDENNDEGFSYKLPEVEYHNMITHWTTDYTFQGLMHKLSDEEEYIILEAETRDKFAFDVNKYRKANGISEVYTEGEREVIFPMYQEHITEHKMNVKQFIELKEKRNNVIDFLP